MLSLLRHLPWLNTSLCNRRMWCSSDQQVSLAGTASSASCCLRLASLAPALRSTDNNRSPQVEIGLIKTAVSSRATAVFLLCCRTPRGAYVRLTTTPFKRLYIRPQSARGTLPLWLPLARSRAAPHGGLTHQDPALLINLPAIFRGDRLSNRPSRLQLAQTVAISPQPTGIKVSKQS